MTALRLENVAKRFGGVQAVTDLSITVESGRVTGLIGSNGAGKTTAVNLITGISAPTSGRIMMKERDLTGVAPHLAARAGISRTFQNVRLLRETSVLDNIVYGFHRHEQTSLFANFVGLPSVWRERRRFREEACELLERFGMTHYAAVPAGSLAYGHQRRVEIMRALAMRPNFLLLDEPVAGMNDVEANGLGTVIRELVKGDLGILVIEHNMRFVMEVCDLIYVMDTGRLIASGLPAEVAADPAVVSAYLGA